MTEQQLVNRIHADTYIVNMHLRYAEIANMERWMCYAALSGEINGPGLGDDPPGLTRRPA